MVRSLRSSMIGRGRGKLRRGRRFRRRGRFGGGSAVQGR